MFYTTSGMLYTRLRTRSVILYTRYRMLYTRFVIPIISNLLHKISIFAGSLAVQVTRPMRVLEIYIETHIHTDIVTKRLME